MSTKPLFSIIIPAYNVESYIDLALNSVLKQSFQHYEIILIDDGSTDTTSQTCAQYALRHPQITWLKQPNQGVSVARNRGIQLSNGRYVMFIDSDDYLIGENVFTHLAHIIEQQPQTDIIFYNILMHNLQEQKIAPAVFLENHLTGNYITDFAQLIQNNVYNASVCNKLIRKDILIRKNIQFPINQRYEDFTFCFELAQHIQHYQIYPKAVYCYRTQRPHSTTSKINIHHLTDYLITLTQTILKLQKLEQQHPLWLGLFQFWQQNFAHFMNMFNIQSPTHKAMLLNNIFVCIQTANSLKQQLKR